MKHHLIYSNSRDELKVFNADGTLAMLVPARNDAIGGTGFGHLARCPLGTYALSAPENNSPPIVSEYAWFIPLVDINGLWVPAGRGEIGIHGGGTGAPAPLDPIWQGAWIPTEGCIRVRNGDLTTLAALIVDGDRIDVLA